MAGRLVVLRTRWWMRGRSCSLLDGIRTAFELGENVRGRALMRDQLNGRQFDAVVHATPLGMYPNVNECFFRDEIPGELVFDMVYNPLETTLIKRAREQGKEVIPGIQMFLSRRRISLRFGLVRVLRVRRWRRRRWSVGMKEN